MSTVDEFTKQKKLEQFQEKLAWLNAAFIEKLQNWIKDCPHYDLTKPAKSYISHVRELDLTYAEHHPKKTEPSAPTNGAPGVRVIAKARRKLESVKPPEKLPVSSTPMVSAPRFRVSDVSAIANDSAQQSPEEKVTETPIAASSVVAPAAARKRAIRGGGPCGGSESIVFRGTDNGSTAGETPAINLGNLPSFPKPSADFWKKAADARKDSTDSAAPAKPTPPPPAAVKEANSKPEPKFPSFSAVFASTTPSKFSFGTIGGDEKKKDEKKVSFAFQPKDTTAASKTNNDASFIFGETKSNDTDKPVPSFPNIFGSSAPAIKLGESGVPVLTFGKVDKPDDQNANDEGEGEYAPPKTEVVKNEEPDSYYSIKCSAFKFGTTVVDGKSKKEYSKLGVGILYLKESDGKKSALLRAGTATGKVLINALLNSSMKVESVDDVKIRLTCPLSESELGIYLLRFPSEPDAKKVLELIQKDAV